MTDATIPFMEGLILYSFAREGNPKDADETNDAHRQLIRRGDEIIICYSEIFPASHKCHKDIGCFRMVLIHVDGWVGKD